MQVETDILITELEKATREVIFRASKFENLGDDDLNWRPAPESWSILECIEHLNLYSDYYLPAITEALANTSHNLPATVFKSGTIGNYMANSMKPDAARKYKTLKDKNPIHTRLDLSALKKFQRQQQEMLHLIAESKKVDLSKTKVPISLTKYLKLRLGDVFRFTIYHNQRHIQQAEKVVEQLHAKKRGRI